MVYLPASGYNNAFNLELVHLFQLSVMRNSTWLGSCLIMIFPMRATFHASLVLWNILLMEASYAGFIFFCHQVICCYYYYDYDYYYYFFFFDKTQGFPQKSSQVSVRMMMMMIMMMMIFSNYCLSVPIDFQGFFSLYKQISLAFFLLKP